MPISINELREDKGGNPERVRESQRRRFASVELVDRVLALDAQWRQKTFEVDNFGKQATGQSKKVHELKQKNEDPSALQEEIRELNKRKLEAEKSKNEIKAQLDEELKKIGNLVHDSVPFSKDEADNAVVCTWNIDKQRPCTADLLHHHQLLHMIDGYSDKSGVDVAGHRGYFLRGVGVLLNQALINYGLQFLMGRKYIPIQPPFFMNQSVMAETAQLSEFDDALYKVQAQEDEKYLIATSEQPISAYHRQEVLKPQDLPIRYAGISTCFRKEAGSHGKDAWGIFRVHQFEKVEQFVITSPKDSWAEQERMIQISQEFYQSLELPFRVVNIVSGELNNAAAKKLDLEAWFPTLGVYRELVSCSNCTDYQARAMDTKIANASKDFAHMLNATLCATERTMCCILENYQTPTGVRVPRVLQPFMMGMEFMPFVKPKPSDMQHIRSEAGQAKKVAKQKAAADSKKDT